MNTGIRHVAEMGDAPLVRQLFPKNNATVPNSIDIDDRKLSNNEDALFKSPVSENYFQGAPAMTRRF